MLTKSVTVVNYTGGGVGKEAETAKFFGFGKLCGSRKGRRCPLLKLVRQSVRVVLCKPLLAAFAVAGRPGWDGGLEGGPRGCNRTDQPGLSDCAARGERLLGGIPGDEQLGPSAGVPSQHGGPAQPRAADPLRRHAEGVRLFGPDRQDVGGQNERDSP